MTQNKKPDVCVITRRWSKYSTWTGTSWTNTKRKAKQFESREQAEDELLRLYPKYGYYRLNIDSKWVSNLTVQRSALLSGNEYVNLTVKRSALLSENV